MSPLKMTLYGGLAIGSIAIVCLLLLLLFPDPVLNRFVKPRITEAFAEAYPANLLRIGSMQYSVVKNRVVFDSVAISTADSSFSGSVGQLSIRAVAWTPLLWGGSLAPDDFSSAVTDARDILLTFSQGQYVLRCEALHVSVPDSEISAEALEIHPPGDDEQFFAESTFRQTSLRCAIPRVRAGGVALLEAAQGKMFRTRSIHIDEPVIDILVNKDKTSAKASSTPLMPNEILASIKDTLEVDRLTILNGGMKYGERFAVGGKRALITLDSMQILAEGIANYGNRDSALVIHAQGEFMQAGTMSVRMSIPVGSPEFSLQYSGSLSRMNVAALNPFLETAEQMRITTGVLQTAAFDITVRAGRANGSVRVVYRDLKLAVINKHTGSETGFADGLASFIANTFKIRGTNLPDKSGAMVIGKVKYVRQREDPFFRFVWFALRSGVGDVVGF